MNEYDLRSEKFALSSEELAALESAIQSMALHDIQHALAVKDARALERAEIIADRRTKQPLGLDIDLHNGTRIPITSKKMVVDARKAIAKGLEPLRTATPLTWILVLIEVSLCNPYAGVKGLGVSDESRRYAFKLIARATPDLGISKKRAEQIAEGAIAAAESVYSNSWKMIGVAVSSLLVVGLGGVIAGPAIAPIVGGLIGAKMLGLSGAAAVSAGLALMGGGSLAAGGFGMVGGTAVITAAMGLAGASAGAGAAHGLNQMFLSEHGAAAARIAMIRHLAIFRALHDQKFLDHDLAADFVDSISLLRDSMSDIATTRERTWRETLAPIIMQGDKDDAARAREVLPVFDAALVATTSWYTDATGRAEVHRTPVAWSKPSMQHGNVKDVDFELLIQKAHNRQNSLGQIVKFLENAHRPVSEVKGESWFKAVRSSFKGATKKRMMETDAMLEAAVNEVLGMLTESRTELASLIETIRKADGLQSQLKQREDIIDRYERLVHRVQQSLKRLSDENDELRSQFALETQSIRKELARAMVSNALFRVSSMQPRKLLGSSESPSDAESGASTDDDQLRLELAIAMCAHPSDAIELAASIQAAGQISPDLTEISEAMGALDLPLGSPMEQVEQRFRTASAQIHPDKNQDPALKSLMAQQLRRLVYARKLHRAHHEYQEGA